ncbi:haloacid dehalogenase [Flavobacterium faecale]|uniref:Haloacid dehalogenase n=1 Tax=Flavobacterium faecale TaxID=1355330 RepID=A0A2S1LE55_9FLAO|nr:Cof-type HAD-IIB family hydrolase [Flavobacterium faecale]AWG22052.1 haloacid dehalogenase [Flavobacterium faecale]
MTNKNTIKVIVTDLDGTLLNTDHQISDYSKTVFKALNDEGYLIIVATGRHHLDAKILVDQLGFPVYLVTSNGARIHSPKNELLYAIDIKSEVIKSVFDIGIPDEFTVVLYKEKVWQTNKHNEKLLKFQPDMKYKPELVDFDKLSDLSTIKLFFTHEKHSKLVALRDRIVAKHEGILSHAFSLPHCLEFMDISVDKSVAIANILEIENFTYEQTIAFGDGYNDEGMLKAAAKGLLMGNAPESLKSKLSQLEVILDNGQNGVAHFLMNTVLNPSRTESN